MSSDTVDKDALVVVTGATGFIASHVVQQLLQAGYRVRGTVRHLPDTALLEHEGTSEGDASLSAGELQEKKRKIQKAKEARDKVDFLYHLCPEAAHPLELVEAELTSADCWVDAVKGAKYVIHVASPFPQSTKKESDLVVPAKEGTLNVLKACVAAKTVKRVVVTGSIVSMFNYSRKGEFTEEHHADPEISNFYGKSKIYAEKTAWEYVESLSEEDKIELVMINPGAVFGPMLNKSVGTSLDIMRQLMLRTYPVVPHIRLHVVDVRDAATCHVNALTAVGAAGHRHIAVNETVWFNDLGEILKNEFSSQGYNPPTKSCPYPFLWMMGIFNSQLSDILPAVGVENSCDNTRMREVLLVKPRPVRDIVIDAVYSLIEAGCLPKKAGYKGPGGKTDE